MANEGNGNGRIYQWAVRGPGMPQKILRSDVELSDERIKKIYLETVKRLESAVHRGDAEVPWRITPMTDADIQKANLTWCLKESRRRNHRALIEYRKGAIVKDVKPIPEAKKENVKVDVKI